MNCLLFPNSILICNSTAVCKIPSKIYHADQMCVIFTVLENNSLPIDV